MEREKALALMGGVLGGLAVIFVSVLLVVIF